MTMVLCSSCSTPIDRMALVERNNPHVSDFNPLSSLTVGNGGFAFTVDATGLQTFPELYEDGVCLGTMSQWGWHSFPNVEGYRFEETLFDYDFGRGHIEPYSDQNPGATDREKAAIDYFRSNPHRLHLGTIGLETESDALPADFKAIDQKLDMWRGVITSSFEIDGSKWEVSTVCHPEQDQISARIVANLSENASSTHPAINLRFPYPSGAHTDSGCDWAEGAGSSAIRKQSTEVISISEHNAVIRRSLDSTEYYVSLSWEEEAQLIEKAQDYYVLSAGSDSNILTFSCMYSLDYPSGAMCQPYAATLEASAEHWKQYWSEGAAVDFSACKDPRASELERRVVLSQYLLATQCAADTPPQETGLTFNSWYGKFHMEMVWWHEAQFALWGRPELLDRTMEWYLKAEAAAQDIAQRQGFNGVRWMKMTDPSGLEAPSSIGSFLIWQQPHPIYLAELLYRSDLKYEVLEKYADIVEKTAEFMADFVSYEPAYSTTGSLDSDGRYVLKGLIPAQETLKPESTVNPPFELSYWRFGLETAQEWRERQGKPRNPEWDKIIEGLSPLAERDGLYLAAESAPDTYSTPELYSDHMAVLGAYGVLPESPQFERGTMDKTLDWVMANWNWEKTWGWDFPMTAMTAARLGRPEDAVDILLSDHVTNTYLPNGHNWQNESLRIYLPGNGGLLTAVAMMCEGWDGSTGAYPGFPKDGKWKVRAEGLSKLP